MHGQIFLCCLLLFHILHQILSKNHLFQKWKYIDNLKNTSSLNCYKQRITDGLNSQKFLNTQVICSFIDIDPVVDYTALTAAHLVREDIPDIQLKIACQTIKGVIQKRSRRLLENSTSM